MSVAEWDWNAGQLTQTCAKPSFLPKGPGQGLEDPAAGQPEELTPPEGKTHLNGHSFSQFAARGWKRKCWHRALPVLCARLAFRLSLHLQSAALLQVCFVTP